MILVARGNKKKKENWARDIMYGNRRMPTLSERPRTTGAGGSEKVTKPGRGRPPPTSRVPELSISMSDDDDDEVEEVPRELSDLESQLHTSTRVQGFISELSGGYGITIVSVLGIFTAVLSVLYSVFMILNVLRIGFSRATFLMWAGIVIVVLNLVLVIISAISAFFGDYINFSKMLRGQSSGSSRRDKIARGVYFLTADRYFSFGNPLVGLIFNAITLFLWIVYMINVGDKEYSGTPEGGNLMDYIQFTGTNILGAGFSFMPGIAFVFFWIASLYYRQMFIILSYLWKYRTKDSDVFTDLYYAIQDKKK